LSDTVMPLLQLHAAQLEGWPKLDLVQKPPALVFIAHTGPSARYAKLDPALAAAACSLKNMPKLLHLFCRVDQARSSRIQDRAAGARMKSAILFSDQLIRHEHPANACSIGQPESAAQLPA